MDTTKRLWWGTAVLSVSALFLTACGDDDADDAPADDAAAEEPAAEETEENGEDTDGDEAEEGATALRSPPSSTRGCGTWSLRLPACCRPAS